MGAPQQFAYLLEQMNASADVGGSLLDNSLVAYGNELGRGQNHSIDNIPFVLAGSCAGTVTTGRFLKFSGTEHNRLLVSIGRAMGLSLDRFGTPDNGNGGLSGFA
jgi:hypothetical protein